MKNVLLVFLTRSSSIFGMMQDIYKEKSSFIFGFLGIYLNQEKIKKIQLEKIYL